MNSIQSPRLSFAKLLQPYTDSKALAGVVVAVADTNQVLSLESAGFADIIAGKAMALDSTFWIASMTKPMTGVGVMMLVDQGKISLDDPAVKYLPDLKHLWVAVYSAPDCVVLRKPTRLPTIRELMSHSAGMQFMAPTEWPLDVMPLDDAVRCYGLTPLMAEPGTKYNYSNMGINAAGRIVEVVSGQPFADFMQTHLMGPLGMKDTTFWPNSEQLMRLAKAYRPTPTNDTLMEIGIDQLTTPYDNAKRAPMPAGGYFSTATDVLRFGQMLLHGGVFEGRRYLSQNAMVEITRNQLPKDVQGSYSIGFAVDADNFGHGGALATNFKVSPEHGLTMAYLIQHGGFLNDGGKIVDTVWKTAVETFGKKKA